MVRNLLRGISHKWGQSGAAAGSGALGATTLNSGKDDPDKKQTSSTNAGSDTLGAGATVGSTAYSTWASTKSSVPKPPPRPPGNATNSIPEGERSPKEPESVAPRPVPASQTTITSAELRPLTDDDRAVPERLAVCVLPGEDGLLDLLAFALRASPLPPPWVQMTDEEGRIYFGNTKELDSQWEHPLGDVVRELATSCRMIFDLPPASRKESIRSFRETWDSDWKREHGRWLKIEGTDGGPDFYAHSDTRAVMWEHPSDLLMPRLVLKNKALDILSDEKMFESLRAANTMLARGGTAAQATMLPTAEVDEDLPVQALVESSWIVDNSTWKARSKGLRHRSSRSLMDFHPTMATPWGGSLKGFDLGDGWLLTTEGSYLPFLMDGCPILIAEDEAAEEKMLRGIFNRCDIDRSARLDKMELVEVCVKDQDAARFFGLPSDEEQTTEAVEKFFEGIDVNNDNKVCFSEFQEFYARLKRKQSKESLPPPTPQIGARADEEREVLVERSAEVVQAAMEEVDNSAGAQEQAERDLNQQAAACEVAQQDVNDIAARVAAAEAAAAEARANEEKAREEIARLQVLALQATTGHDDEEDEEEDQEDLIELTFQDMSFDDLDQEAFKADLLENLAAMGISEDAREKLQFRLRRGSVIVEILAPSESLSEVREKPIQEELKVLGQPAVVTRGAEPLPPKRKKSKKAAAVEEVLQSARAAERALAEAREAELKAAFEAERKQLLAQAADLATAKEKLQEQLAQAQVQAAEQAERANAQAREEQQQQQQQQQPEQSSDQKEEKEEKEEKQENQENQEKQEKQEDQLHQTQEPPATEEKAEAEPPAAEENGQPGPAISGEEAPGDQLEEPDWSQKLAEAQRQAELARQERDAALRAAAEVQATSPIATDDASMRAEAALALPALTHIKELQAQLDSSRAQLAEALEAQRQLSAKAAESQQRLLEEHQRLESARARETEASMQKQAAERQLEEAQNLKKELESKLLDAEISKHGELLQSLQDAKAKSQEVGAGSAEGRDSMLKLLISLQAESSESSKKAAIWQDVNGTRAVLLEFAGLTEKKERRSRCCALATLWNLATEPSNRLSMFNDVPQLVASLLDALATDAPQLQHCAIATLQHLSEERENRSAMWQGQTGIREALLKAAASEDLSVRERALSIFWNLSAEAALGPPMWSDASGVRATLLANASRRPSPTSASSSSPEVSAKGRMRAIAALHNLTAAAQNKASIWADLPTREVLVEMASSAEAEDRRARTYALAALQNLSTDVADDIWKDTSARGAILLAASAASGTDLKARTTALYVLQNLARVQANRAAIWTEDPRVQLLLTEATSASDLENRELQESALITIWNLSSEALVASSICKEQHELLRSIVATAGLGIASMRRVRLCALRVLQELAGQAAERSVLWAMTSLREAVATAANLLAPTDRLLREAAIRILFSLALDAENKVSMWEHLEARSALLTAASLTDVAERKIRICALGALQSLSSDHAVRDAMWSDQIAGAPHIFVEAAKSDEPANRIARIGAIASLQNLSNCGSEDTLWQLPEARAVLLEVASSTSSDRRCRGCALGALRNLAAKSCNKEPMWLEEPSLRPILLEAGVSQAPEDREVRECALGACWNLASNANNCASMREDTELKQMLEEAFKSPDPLDERVRAYAEATLKYVA